jgi:sensor histidine kinase YesM
MQKHLLRLFFILLAFELIRTVGAEIPIIFRGQPAFKWFDHKYMILLKFSGFFIFVLYPLISFIILRSFFLTDKKRTFLYLLIAVLCIITLRYLIQEVFFLHVFGFRNYFANVPLLYYYVDNIYFAAVYSAFGIIYFFVQNEHRRLLENKQLQLENKQTQLSFLQSQVNPHFLFNSLNNIYSLIYHNSSHSLDAVAKLSDILRYMLYDSGETVSLQKEWDYIQKYIELQQLRFDHPVRIEKEVTGDLQSVSAVPFILIPFVENAFKHGDFKQDGSLKMQLNVSNKEMHFHIFNKKRKGTKDGGSGIGLENIKRRLELLYPGKHVLNIQEINDTFMVDLKLNYE